MTLARPSRAQVEAGTGPPGVESYPGRSYTCIGPKKHGMGRHWGEVWEQSWNYPPPPACLAGAREMFSPRTRSASWELATPKWVQKATIWAPFPGGENFHEPPPPPPLYQILITHILRVGPSLCHIFVQGKN